jgi:UDP-glucose 4-epimerase
MMQWPKARTLVTGGASFIGSHLVDALVERGADVRVVDNVSSGTLDNIRCHIEAGRVELFQADLRDGGVADLAVRGIDVVFPSRRRPRRPRLPGASPGGVLH